jgi:hypothetical protein
MGVDVDATELTKQGANEKGTCATVVGCFTERKKGNKIKKERGEESTRRFFFLEQKGTKRTGEHCV